MVDANPPQIYLTISSWWIHGNSSSHFLKSDRRSNSLDVRSACCSIERKLLNSQFDSPAPRPGVTMSSQIFIISSTIAAGWALWKANANDRLPRSHSIMCARVRVCDEKMTRAIMRMLDLSRSFPFLLSPVGTSCVHRRTQYKNAYLPACGGDMNNTSSIFQPHSQHHTSHWRNQIQKRRHIVSDKPFPIIKRH